MKIEQLLIQPIGTKINPGTLTIKTCKKTWEVDGVWYHQVILMDDTDEIPADVKIGKYNPLHRGSKIKVIVAEVRDTEYLGKPRKILFVDQFTIPTTSMAEYEQGQDQMDDELRFIVEGKIRHGEVCRYMGAGVIRPKMTRQEAEAVKDSILYWQEFIMKGE